MTSHKGTDYKANYEKLYLPFTGTVSFYSDYGGGKWLKLVRADNGDVIELAHLSKYLVSPGFYQEGTPVAITGNSGVYTTNPHLHVQVKIKGQLVDPEKYDWNKNFAIQRDLKIQILMNNQPFWNSLLKHMANIQHWGFESSGGRIIPRVNYKHISLSGWSTEFVGSDIGGMKVEVIKKSWMAQNVMKHADGADIVLFCMARKDWKGSVFDHPELIELGYAYQVPKDIYSPNVPLMAMLVVDEHDDYPPYYPKLGAFAKLAWHEISHLLYPIYLDTEKKFVNPQTGQLYSMPPGTDLTHQHFYGENGFTMRPEDIFNDLKYENLA